MKQSILRTLRRRAVIPDLPSPQTLYYLSWNETAQVRPQPSIAARHLQHCTPHLPPWHREAKFFKACIPACADPRNNCAGFYFQVKEPTIAQSCQSAAWGTTMQKKKIRLHAVREKQEWLLEVKSPQKVISPWELRCCEYILNIFFHSSILICSLFNQPEHTANALFCSSALCLIIFYLCKWLLI